METRKSIKPKKNRKDPAKIYRVEMEESINWKDRLLGKRPLYKSRMDSSTKLNNNATIINSKI